mmetsp:Transcript_25787/g.48760  ORF Transcript_25787/g.48760 Transcript_25787/m.48760 type:complete len:293 (+) Transcript_25787:2-880(+)
MGRGSSTITAPSTPFIVSWLHGVKHWNQLARCLGGAGGWGWGSAFVLVGPSAEEGKCKQPRTSSSLQLTEMTRTGTPPPARAVRVGRQLGRSARAEAAGAMSSSGTPASTPAVTTASFDWCSYTASSPSILDSPAMSSSPGGVSISTFSRESMSCLYPLAYCFFNAIHRNSISSGVSLRSSACAAACSPSCSRRDGCGMEAGADELAHCTASAGSSATESSTVHVPSKSTHSKPIGGLRGKLKCASKKAYSHCIARMYSFFSRPTLEPCAAAVASSKRSTLDATSSNAGLAY